MSLTPFSTINLTQFNDLASLPSLGQLGAGSTSFLPTSNALSTDSSATTGVMKDNDTRVRLRAMRGAEKQVYGEISNDNILSIMNPSADRTWDSVATGGTSNKTSATTDGLLFPYTPSIGFSQSVDYKEISMIQTNGDYSAYSRTPSVSLRVSGKFTVQNQREGRYLLAVIHFLRTVSKSYFGEIDAGNKLAGLPPPVLIFSGYGNYMFNELPVIVKSHDYSLDDNMDTVEIQTASGIARLPAMLTINMELTVQQTPQKMRKEFSLDEFRTGALMRDGKTGWI